MEEKLSERRLVSNGESSPTLPCWEESPDNPVNWSTQLKVRQVFFISSAAFTATLGASIVSPCHERFMHEFQIGSTAALLPLCLYTFSLGMGPVLGGPLSENLGRYPIYIGTLVVGSLFTLGAGFTRSFGGLCVLRFLAGFTFAPILAVSPGTIKEMFMPQKGALPTAILILCPFIGTGAGPVLGGFLVERKGWQWTQWTLIFFSGFSLIFALTTGETYRPAIEHRISKRLGHCSAPKPSTPWKDKMITLAKSTLLRPLSMLCKEKVVTLTCLYIACEFATMFSFFAAFPFVYKEVYSFTIEQSGLIFLAIVIGSVLGAFTVVLFDVLFYRHRSAKLTGQSHPFAPELRLYPSMIGSIGLPTGLFWFGWTSHANISWACPTVAVLVFSWGNMCIFLSMTQYIMDSYPAHLVASAMSANSLTRYGLSAVFPLFTIQMYKGLGIGWASSLLGFLAATLCPIPWLFFFMGDKLRNSSELAVSESLEES
ncbi:unnamed protein product [Penicillium salamii]|nr:unnamed protein product [Penicillium salamii]